MSTTVQIKGLIVPGAGCNDGCSGSGAAAACAFDLAFRNCSELYGQVRSGDVTIATLPNAYIDLPIADALTAIEFVAIKSSGPITLRVNGLPASATTAALFPAVALPGQTLTFTVDGTPLSVLFAAGEDTALEAARRINAEAALAGLAFAPASVAASGQVVISGALTGAQGSLTAFTGTAVATLGLGAFTGAVGTGADVPIDGVSMIQFPRGAAAARRLEVSGSASLSVLAAGT